MADITLSSATRSNLLSLQRTTNLIDQTQERLSTGKKVNSAIDDALAFFKAREYNSNASDLATIKDNILQGINVIETATQALESAEDILKQMKATAEAAKSEQSDTARGTLATQYEELATQLDYMLKDAVFNGINLVGYADTSEGLRTLEVSFSLDSASQKLTVAGTNLTSDSAGLAVSGGSVNTTAWSNDQSVANSAVTAIDAALDTVRGKAAEYGRNAALLEIRKDFTENMINTLETGAGQLVNADVNAESANMLSLQTRQQLGTISLSIAQQSEQSVLRLF